MSHKSKSHKSKSFKGPVRAKKSLGQHFLKDENVALKISKTIVESPTKNTLEIGPGTGVLTKYLLKNGSYLTVMEVDRDSIAYLKNDFFKEHLDLSSNNLEILEGDFLKYNLNELFKDEEFTIIGNFPYNISSQILFKALENRQRIPFFSGMFQKEVAKRICEKPGTKAYGILSVLTQAFYKPEYLFTVPPSVFLPPPKVDSGVLRLIRKENFYLECNETLFFKVVKQAFQQRRKTLRNSLKGFNLSEETRKKEIFSQRPEQLSVSEFSVLTNLVEENINAN